MTTLEDKILGEKAQNYCSSSEDEGNESDSDKKTSKSSATPAAAAQLPPPNKWSGTATNTGPKGVKNDWERFKQLEAEARIQQEQEKIAMMKKLTLTCMSAQEEEEYKKQKEIDDELDELLNDEILLNYQKQRMQEMLALAGRLPNFGKLIHLKSSEEFLDAVDKENKGVMVVVHLFEENVEACKVMNGCLISLAQDYPRVKFCKLVGSAAGVSRQFKVSGVPALLIYKSGQMIGNFVRLTDIFGDDFYASDVENFLIEHGLLLDKSFIPAIISSQNDNESDVSLD